MQCINLGVQLPIQLSVCYCIMCCSMPKGTCEMIKLVVLAVVELCLSEEVRLSQEAANSLEAF